MPVVNPGIRRFLGSAIQRLFNGASFSAPLTHSAIPTRAAPGTTGTFTRATTSTWPNNDGYLVTGLAGEIGFPGARRVRNLITGSSEVFSGWTGAATVTYGVSDPDGGMTASTLTGSAANTERYLSLGASPVGGKILSSWWIRRRTGTGSIRFYNGSSSVTDITSTLTTEWQQFSSTTTTSGGTIYVGVFISTSGDAVDVWHPQTEDVTAQTTQTAGEYVSVGVPSDWAGDELVTNGTFDTATTGWTAGEILGGAAGTLSVNSGRLRITNTGTSYGAAYQTFATVIGTRYVLSGSAYLGSNALWAVRLGSTGFPSFDYGNPSSGADGSISISFIATTTSTTLTLYGLNYPDAYVEFDNISVKPAYYHGSMVDGVKCFPTDLSGNPIPSTTLLGYSAEGARTNLCLQSNAFTTTWLAIGTPAATQNATGLDGGTTAWTLTDNDGAASEEIYQSIVLSAAAHTFSVFVKKTVGAQSSYPCLLFSPVVGAVNFSAVTIDTTNGIATAWTAYTGRTMASGISTSCVSYNDDFWRVSLTATATAEAWYVEIFPAGTTNATQSTGVIDTAATGSAVFYGAQVELGSFASSPIATTTAAVTRNADVLTYSSAGNIANAAGWVYAEVLSNNVGASTQADVLTDSSTFALYARNDLGKTRFFNGTVDVSLSDIAIPFAQSKLLWTWTDAVSATGAVNGVATTAVISGNLAIGANLRVGGGVGTVLGGNIRNLRIGTRRLSESESVAVTQ